jgi:glutathione peroxidase
MTRFHDFVLIGIDGKTHPATELRGNTVLVVNVASRCGYTPQYAGLQTLFKEFESRGLIVLGVPSNEFGAQEPGSNEEIQTFCETKFAVTFPMMEKVVVKGPGQHPLYQWLTTVSNPSGDVRWNFEKFLINGEGDIIGRFGSAVSPESAELREAIQAALG